MARKPKKPYRPATPTPAAPVVTKGEASDKAKSIPMPEPRSKPRVREVKISAKERSAAAKKAGRLAFMKRSA